MSYIQDKEKTVFLHFLNREASEATRVFRTAEQDLRFLDVITFTHCSNMTVNVSQMLEYTIDRPELVQPLSRLCASGILVTTSHDKNFSEFISSRRRMYERVAQRYPIYFTDLSVLESFSIRQKNNFSMTSVLRRDILDISDRDVREPALALEQRHAHREDWRIFSDRIEPIQRVFGTHRHEAITRGNLEFYLNQSELEKAELDAVARVISARYFDHYKKHSASVICTGIGDIGFVEDYELFPHYDLPILSAVLNALSWAKLKRSNPDLREQLYASYGNRSHVSFVANLQSFVGACCTSIRDRLNYPEGSSDYFFSLRSQTETLCSHLIFSSVEGDWKFFRNIDDYFDWSVGVIQRAIDQEGSAGSRVFGGWEKLMNIKDRSRILLLTATDTEDDALDDALTAAGYRNAGYVRTAAGVCSRFTLGQNKEIVHARSGAGSVGSSGSELVAAEAMRDLKPDFVIAVGICFGMKPSQAEQEALGKTSIDKGEQSLGDILFSEKVTDYETVRLCFENGEESIRERGFRVPGGSVLLDAARIARRDYRTGKTSVYPGELLSGLKLLDSPPSVEELKKRFPDAIGGEMEASGIVAASLRHGVSWLVVKAICDWGYSKGKKEQALAAGNAAQFAMKIVSIVQEAKSAK